MEPEEVRNEVGDRILKYPYTFPLLAPKKKIINRSCSFFFIPFRKEVPGQLPEVAEKLFKFNSPELIAIHLAGLVPKAGQN